MIHSAPVIGIWHKIGCEFRAKKKSEKSAF